MICDFEKFWMRLYLVRFCRSVRCTVYLLYTVSLMGEVRSRFFFVPNSKFVRSYVLVVVVVEREGATSYLAHNWISQNGGNFATDSSLHSSADAPRPFWRSPTPKALVISNYSYSYIVFCFIEYSIILRSYPSS